MGRLKRELRTLAGLCRLKLRLYRVSWTAGVFTGVALPLLAFLAIGAMAPAARDRALVGVLVFSALMSITHHLGFTMALDRQLGRCQLLATTALTRGRYLAAHVPIAATLALLPLVVAAVALFATSASPPRSTGWLLPYGLSALGFAALGPCLAAVGRGMATTGFVVNLTTVVAVTVCPLFYPLERVPQIARPLVAVLPPTLATEAIAAAWSGGSVADWHLALLALWTVALMALAGLCFPWTRPLRV